MAPPTPASPALQARGLCKDFRGFLAVSSGSVSLFGRDLSPVSSPDRSHPGVARSFQITSLVENLSPREHVELALQGLTMQGFRFWRSDKSMRKFRARSDELLEEVGLQDLADKPAGVLAYGQKRALEMALVAALDPRVLLLDEPTAGMGVEDVDRTIDLVRQIARGRTIIFVDHDMHVVGSLADRVTVLQAGKVLAEGTYDEVRTDESVVTAYLGEAADA